MNIEQIIARISNQGSPYVYVGKNYTTADLVADLRAYDEEKANDMADAVMEAIEFGE